MPRITRAGVKQAWPTQVGWGLGRETAGLSLISILQSIFRDCVHFRRSALHLLLITKIYAEENSNDPFEYAGLIS